MQKNRKSFASKSSFKGRNGHIKSRQNSNNKSLLQKIASNKKNTIQKQNHQSGKLVITKLNDYVEDKCQYGKNCAHLRAQSKCEFLHQKKDFEALSLQLPQKFLQNQQPLKKSKQQRKEDKIRQRAERQERLKEKLQRQERHERRQDKNEKRQKEEDHQQKVQKKVEQKNIDQKQILIQKILKTQKGFVLSVDDIYAQLNSITDAYCQQKKNSYQQEFNLNQIKMSMFEIRKRLFVKLKKNKQFELLQKKFIEKQGGIIKKLIKNVFTACNDLVEEIKNLQKCQNLDLRQIQQIFTLQDVQRVLKSKKQNQAFIEYYFRFFKPQYGFPLSFQIPEHEHDQISLNKGSLLPLKNYQLLPIISPNFEFQRIFLSLDITFTQLKALSELSSLLIPQKIAEKTEVQKTFVLDMTDASYNKFVDQILTEYMVDYHQKMKGPSKQFQFGKIEQNLQKFRNFVSKYKTKIESQNKENSFVLVVYNIKELLDKITQLQMAEHLSYGSIKKDRTFQEQKIYEKVFLLREFIIIMNKSAQIVPSFNEQNPSKKIKVVYVNNGKKLKLNKFRPILQTIDEGLKETTQESTIQKMIDQ